ncbi:histidine kinase [Flavobacteriales bacterium]|jgi:two-component system LytT family sensor kinase|nr:histidine kinase [Flavobacteriales bacterium]MDB9932345.1 histidine kinase [Flavobacteriales bacterium]
MVSLPDIKVNYRVQYFIFQLLGWGFFVFLIGLFNLSQNGINTPFVLLLLIVFLTNLLISHLYRFYVSKNEWLVKSIGPLLLRILVASVVLGVFFSFSISVTRNVLMSLEFSYLNWNEIFFGAIVYFIWSILYFGYLLFYKARKEEYKNLEMLALSSEAELKNLRSQLNPHFMFNAMNSIRALIDENPEESKKAVTQLSNVLRASLIHAKREKVTLEEELTLVNDYLSLEKIRYEERLEVVSEVDDKALPCLVPPLLIQTLVENGIKHGISKLIKGGVIKIEVRLKSQKLFIEISNTGKLNDDRISKTGIGVENTKKRLRLLYGNSASFELVTENEIVKSVVVIPIN